MTPARTLALLALLTGVADADELPRVPSTLPLARMPRHLAMRALPPPVVAPTPAATSTTPRRRRRRATVAPALPVTPPPKLSAQLSLGLAVDGAGLRNLAGTAPATGTTVGGATYASGETFTQARAYNYGDLFLGSHGLIVPSVSTYLASQFRIAPQVGSGAPMVDAWDRVDPLRVRAAWTEAAGVIDQGPLRSLKVRAGRQFVTGPAIAHIDGLLVSWAPSGLRLAGYLGSRVPDWSGPDRTTDARRLLVGGEAMVELRRGARPLALRARGLRYDDHSHADLSLDWRPRADVTLAFTSRTVDDQIANHRATVRIRVSDETRLVLDGTVRKRADWLWDYERVDDTADPTRPRRYLDLGPAAARTTLRARAGTVLLDNIDTLLFGGLAFDNREPGEAPTRTSPGWLEGGSAIEVRLRRTLSLSLSGLGRIYARTDAVPAAQVIDLENQVQPLPTDPDHLGERSLIEGGVVARFLGGARKFSAGAEIYARRTRYARLYRDDGVADSLSEAQEPLDDSTVSGGGRFTFDGWISPRLRLHAEYELSNRFASSPEIAGLKSLRLAIEGRY